MWRWATLLNPPEDFLSLPTGGAAESDGLDNLTLGEVQASLPLVKYAA